MPEKPIIELQNITREFVNGEVITRVLHGIDLVVKKKEFLAIMGPSGSGKSTLMHIMGFLDRPSSGRYLFLGKKTKNLSEDELATLRRDEVGFVFQFFYLLQNSTVLDNVLLPMVYAGISRPQRLKRAKKVLKDVELSHRLKHLSNQLSGGEKQRVAIARSTVNDPTVIFADEPTGNLDSKSGEIVMKILSRLNKEGHTIIMVTHEEETAAYSKRIIRMRDGLIISDEKNQHQKRKGLRK